MTLGISMGLSRIVVQSNFASLEQFAATQRIISNDRGGRPSQPAITRRHID